MSWFVLSIFSIVALAAAELSQQHLFSSQKTIGERTSTTLTFLVEVGCAFLFLIGSGNLINTFNVFSWSIFPFVFSVSLLASIGMVFYLRSFQVKSISLSAIFVSLSVIVSTTLGIVFFHESTSPVKFLGIILILLGVISLNIKNITLEKNHYFGLLAGIFFGTAYTIDKLVLQSIHPSVYMFWSFLILILITFFIDPWRVLRELKSAKLPDLKFVAYSGVAYFIYNLATYFAYIHGGEVGKVDAINNTQIFLIILVEFFILKQKQGIFRKLLAACLAFAGVLILGYL